MDEERDGGKGINMIKTDCIINGNIFYKGKIFFIKIKMSAQCLIRKQGGNYFSLHTCAFTGIDNCLHLILQDSKKAIPFFKPSVLASIL